MRAGETEDTMAEEKKKIMIQVTDDPRFYPQPLSEKQKYRLKKLEMIP